MPLAILKAVSAGRRLLQPYDLMVSFVNCETLGDKIALDQMLADKRRHISAQWASLMAQWVKHPPAMKETCGFDSWVGKIPGGANSNPLQYSYLKKSHR